MKKIYIKEFTFLLVGCLIYAFSMVVINPIELIPGSVLGVSVICHKVLNWQTGLTNFLMNIPIMIICVKCFGRKILYYTIIILAGTSALIDWFCLAAPTHVYAPAILISVLGGALMGIGAGLLLLAGGTMGGTTAIARMINKKNQEISIGNSLIIMDCCIVIVGAIALHSVKALIYSLIYSIVCAKVIDLTYLVYNQITGFRDDTVQ